MTTFLEAYSLCGPDVERIASLLGIEPSEADRLINAEMNRLYAEKVEAARARRHAKYIRSRDQLRQIRAERPA